MVWTPINLVRGLVRPGLFNAPIWPLLSVDPWDGKGLKERWNCQKLKPSLWLTVPMLCRCAKSPTMLMWHMPKESGVNLLTMDSCSCVYPQIHPFQQSTTVTAKAIKIVFVCKGSMTDMLFQAHTLHLLLCIAHVGIDNRGEAFGSSCCSVLVFRSCYVRAYIHFSL